MATSMIRRLFTNTGRTALILNGLKTATNRSRKSRTSLPVTLLQKCCSKTFAAGGVGVTFGLLGFSFGQQKTEEEEPDPLTLKYREARLAHSRQDLKAADGFYHEALQLADDMAKKKKITEEKHVTARTLMYDGLADIALITGNFEAAEALFKEVLKGCLQQGLEENSNVIVEISLKLASIYAMQERKVEAEEGYKFCVAMQHPKMEDLEKDWSSQDAAKVNKTKEDISKDAMEAKQSDTAVLLGMTLGSYGRFLMYEKRFQEAFPLFERSRVLCKNTMGTDTNQYTTILNDIATLYIITQNFDKAEEVLKEGIAISQKAELAELAVLHCNMGALSLRRGDLDGAVKSCALGRDIATKFDHKLAHRNAEACLRKVASVRAEKEKKAAEEKK